MRPVLTVVAAATLAAAASLVPSAASADTPSYWLTPHPQSSKLQKRVADPANDITWTVLDHKVVVTTSDIVVVPLVYTCGNATSPQDVQYSPAVIQAVYADFPQSGVAGIPGGGSGNGDVTFTCDGAQHTQAVVFNRFTFAGADSSKGFENGNVEVGLLESSGSNNSPTFEHAVVGYDQLHDQRAKVAVTVNATPESTKPGSKITVKGTVKRDGKAYKNKDATLYFQSEAGAPAEKVGSDEADSKGNLTTKVTVTGPGTYFWTTTSTSKTQAGASLGDYAASVNA